MLHRRNVFPTPRSRIAPRTVLLAGLLCCSLADIAAAAGDLAIVAFGDSTTAPRGKLMVYSDLLARELPTAALKVRMINAGIGGNNTDMARKRFEKDILARQPDIVIIQFGINDAAVDVWKSPPATQPRVSLDRYRENLLHFVTPLRESGARVILMTPNPLRWTPSLKQRYGRSPYDPDDEDGFNLLLRDYAAAVRVIARQHDIPLVDVDQAFHDYDRQPEQSLEDLLLDGMHPNERGHRLIAKLLMSELQKPAND